MNAKQFYNKINDKFEACDLWECDECGKLYQTEDSANYCCQKSYCKECGKEAKHCHTLCEDCKAIAFRKKHKELMDAAELIEKCGAFVYYEEEYHNTDNLFDYFIDHDNIEECEEFAFDCDPKPYKAPNVVEWVQEDCYDKMYEDAAEDLVGLEDLQKAVEEFELANQKMVAYEVNYKRKVSIKDILDDAKKERAVEQNT